MQRSEPPHERDPAGTRRKVLFWLDEDATLVDGDGATPAVTGRRRRWRTPAIAIVLVAALIGAAAALPWSAGRAPQTGTLPWSPSAPADTSGAGATAAGTVITAPRADVTRANLELLSGTTAVSLRRGAGKGDLYRIATPDGGSTVPTVLHEQGRLMVDLVDSGRSGPDTVDIQLNPQVTWDLRFTGGAVVRLLDLSGLSVSGLVMTGGSARTELTLPAPDGTVPVRMVGGVGEFTVRLPQNIPVQVRIGGGAGTATLDNQVRTGVAAGTVLATPDWATATHRYDIDVASGASTVTVVR